jgi:hypothetical protein
MPKERKHLSVISSIRSHDILRCTFRVRCNTFRKNGAYSTIRLYAQCLTGFDERTPTHTFYSSLGIRVRFPNHPQQFAGQEPAILASYHHHTSLTDVDSLGSVVNGSLSLTSTWRWRIHLKYFRYCWQNSTGARLPKRSNDIYQAIFQNAQIYTYKTM